MLREGQTLYRGKKTITVAKVKRKYAYDKDGNRIDPTQWSTQKPKRRWTWW